jgi:predicted phage-related endonuclease
MAASTSGDQPRLAQIDSAAPDAELRHTFIGGSEAFELLYQSHYGRGCARALAYRKLQTPEDVPTATAKERAIGMRGILHRGHLLEDLAARLYMNATGRSLLRRARLVRHPDFPGAAVHTDRIVVALDERGTGDAEIKTHGEGPFLNILRNGLPTAHSLQLQWSMFCTGHQWGVFIVLGVFGELPLKHFDVARDPDAMLLFEHAVPEFWARLRAGDLPPQLRDADDKRCKVCPFRLTCRGETLDPEEYHRLLAEREGKTALTPMANDELDQALADRALILSEMEALSNESDDPDELGALQLVTRRIKELIGDQEAVLVNQHWKVYLRDHIYRGMDISRLKEEQPEIYKKYFVSRPTGTRALRVYALHDKRVA